jgi:serine-type D-Ala-D-Ala carboxypeptidase/endopeptidase (penicillin-binding protein 4)
MMRRMLSAGIGLVATATLCGVGVGQTAAAGTSGPGLGAQIAAMVAEPAVARAHWGVMVTELDGTPIYGLNEGQLFQPASNAKLFTTTAAVALLGPEKTFETTVRGRLDATSGTVTGDLVILGAGDANLSGRELPYLSPGARPKNPGPQPAALRYLEEMADQVAARGVKVVTGDVVGDDTLFPWEPYPSDWSIDDAVWGYGAPVSALTVADNQMQLTITPGTITGAKGRETHHDGTAVLEQHGVPYYTLQTHVPVTPAKTPSAVQVERAIGSRVVRVYGQMANGSDADGEEIAIEDPAEYAAMAFRGMLEARGIKVQGGARAKHRAPSDPFGFLTSLHAPGGAEDVTANGGAAEENCYVHEVPAPTLASHQSVPLGEDVVLTNKVSQNLHAELLLRHLGQRAGCGDGSAVAGARMVRAFLLHAGIDKDDFVFYDGSGLSGHDLVTPRATAKLLQFAAMDPKTGAPQPWFADWKKSLPVGGEDGTLGGRFAKAPLKDHLFAKTGTLGEARALSGYLECASGRTVVFSIMVGNHAPGTSADRDVMDRVVGAIWAAE